MDLYDHSFLFTAYADDSAFSLKKLLHLEFKSILVKYFRVFPD